MDKDLKMLLAELVEGDTFVPPPASAIPAPEATESNSEEAWNDFQDSQLAYEKTFQDSKPGAL